MAKKVPVKFLMKQSPYNAGEVAGFKPAEAEKLVERGVARHLKESDGVEARPTIPMGQVNREERRRGAQDAAAQEASDSEASVPAEDTDGGGSPKGRRGKGRRLSS